MAGYLAASMTSTHATKTPHENQNMSLDIAKCPRGAGAGRGAHTKSPSMEKSGSGGHELQRATLAGLTCLSPAPITEQQHCVTRQSSQNSKTQPGGRWTAREGPD